MEEEEKAPALEIPQWRRDSLSKALSEGPRNEAGDPAFTFEDLEKYFKREDIAWLCNRTLYQEDYQRAYHKKRQEKKKELRRAERLRLLSEPSRRNEQVVSVVKSLLATRKARELRREKEEAAKLKLEALAPPPELSEAQLEDRRRLDEAFARPERERKEEE